MDTGATTCVTSYHIASQVAKARGITISDLLEPPEPGTTASGVGGENLRIVGVFHTTLTLPENPPYPISYSLEAVSGISLAFHVSPNIPDQVLLGTGALEDMEICISWKKRKEEWDTIRHGPKPSTHTNSPLHPVQPSNRPNSHTPHFIEPGHGKGQYLREKEGAITCYALRHPFFNHACKFLDFQPNLDCCASASNRKCERYISLTEEMASFSTDLFNTPISVCQQYRCYVNPPFESISKFIYWALLLQKSCMFVVPVWPNCFWWGVLTKISSKTYYFNEDEKIFSREGKPCKPPKWRVAACKVDKTLVKDFLCTEEGQKTLQQYTKLFPDVTKITQLQKLPGQSLRVNRVFTRVTTRTRHHINNISSNALDNMLLEFRNLQFDRFDTQIEQQLESDKTLKVQKITAHNNLHNQFFSGDLFFKGIDGTGDQISLVFSRQQEGTIADPLVDYHKLQHQSIGAVSDLHESDLEPVDSTVLDPSTSNPATNFVHPNKELQRLVREKHLAFAPRDHDPQVNRSAGFFHEIHLKEVHKNFAVKPHKCSVTESDALKKYIDEYLSRKWIQPSNSDFASRVFLVPKKTLDASGKQELRLVIDYRRVNDLTVRQHWAMPDIRGLHSQLAKSTLFTALDLEAGYHHIPMTESAKRIAAFITPFGHFEPNVLMFGLHSAPAIFQQMVDTVFKREIQEGWAHIYLDDILLDVKIQDPTQAECVMLQRLGAVLDKVIANNMTVKLKKCVFLEPEVQWLGHTVGHGRSKMDTKKVEAILQYERPTTTRQLQRFLGMVVYYSQYVQGFSQISTPLYYLLRGGFSKRNVKFAFSSGDPLGETPTFITKKNKRVAVEKKEIAVWGEAQEEAFQQLKRAVAEQPCLQLPDVRAPFQVWTDASSTTLGAILEQHGRPVEFWSKGMTTHQQLKYSTYEKELLALTAAIKRWRHMIHNGQVCEVFVDNKALCQILSQQAQPNRLQLKLISEVADLHLDIIHVESKLQRADGLTRTKDVVNTVPHTDQYGNPVRKKEELPIAKPFSPIQGQSNESVDARERIKMKWQTAYENDTTLGPIFFTLHNKKVCNVDEEYIRKHYQLSGGLVYKKTWGEWKVAVPFQLREGLLQRAHNLTLHHGTPQTLKKLDYYWWPGMREEVYTFIQQCPVCAMSRGFQHPEYGIPTPLVTPAQPRQRLHVDTIMGLPECNGCTQLLTVIDAYSRFALAFPISQNFSSSDFCRIFKTHILPTFGPVETIVSDSGTPFISTLTRTQMSICNTQMLTTAAYHHEANGLVERLHRELNKMLRVLTIESGRRWYEDIGLLVHVHNTCVHSALGMSPYSVHHNTHLTHDFLSRWESSFLPDPKCKDHYLARQFLSNKEKLETVMKKERDRQLRTLEKRRSGSTPEFKAGDEVWVRNKDFGPKEFSRFLPRLVGPYRVLEKRGNNYYLQVPTHSFDPLVNVKRLEPFRPTTPHVAISGLDFVDNGYPQRKPLDNEDSINTASFDVAKHTLVNIVGHSVQVFKNFPNTMQYTCILSKNNKQHKRTVPFADLVYHGWVHKILFQYVQEKGNCSLPSMEVLKFTHTQWLLGT